MRILLLGIGNPILGDDGVGVRVAQELARKIKDESIEIKDTSADSLNLLELIVGYDKLVIIDAIMTDAKKAGRIYRLKPENLCHPSHPTASPHHLNLATTIEIGRMLFPEEMPQEVAIFAIGTQQVTEVTEEMTAKVKQAIPKVVDLILKEVNAA
jgi:hydrogenase maturation protease